MIIGALPLFPINAGGASDAPYDSQPASRENLAPQIQITHPANQATVKGTIVIMGKASDDVQVTNVSVHIKKVAYQAVDTSGNNTWFTWNYTLDTTKYPDGLLNIGAVANDSFLLADAGITVNVKNAPPDGHSPSVSIVLPHNNTEVKNTIVIKGHATDNVAVKWVDVVIAGKEYVPTDMSGNGSWFKWTLEFNTTVLTNGEHWVNAHAGDGTNIGKDRILIIVNNTVPKENHWPFVEITHPASDATVAGEITIKGKAWDVDGNITLVYLIIAEKHYNATDTSGNGTWYTWELKFNTTLLTDGEYRIVAISKDDGGKLGDFGVWVLVKNTKVENQAPHAEINHPANEATVSGVIIIKGKAWDVDGKIVDVKVRIAEVKYNATDTSGNGSWYTWKLEFNTSKLADGEYRVSVIAWDDGEKATDPFIWIIVKNHKENHLPHVEITHPANEAKVSGVIKITGKAWDVDGKVVKVKVRIFEVYYTATDTSGNGSWYTWKLEFNTTKLKDGEYKVTALAYDDKEALEDAGIWIIIRNHRENSSPFVDITHPKTHARVSGVIVIKGNAWDIDGHVAKVKIKIYDVWYTAKDTSGNESWYTWSFEFNTTKLENGWYRVSAAVYDGTSWGDDHIYIYINNTHKNKCPGLKINHPKNHAEVSGKVVISGEAWDEDNRIISVKIKIGEHEFQAKLVALNQTWYNWKFIWNTTNFENGEYKIGVIVSDGHCKEDASVVVVLNNTKEKDNSKDTGNEGKSEDKDKKSSPLPGFDGPLTLTAAAVAAVVVSFFRSDWYRNRIR